MVDVPAGGEKLPTARQLRKSGVAAVRERMGQDLEISVFQNGYVLYREGKHSTVFLLHSCRDYHYLSGENVIHLPEQFFDNREWYLRLILEGEDRLNRNHEEKERSWNVSYSAVSEEWVGAGNLLESVMDYLVRQETVEELLQVLTEKQKCIVQKYYLQEKTQEQISKELGISQQAVSAMLVRAVKSMREKCPTFQDFSGYRSYCAEGKA